MLFLLHYLHELLHSQLHLHLQPVGQQNFPKALWEKICLSNFANSIYLLILMLLMLRFICARHKRCCFQNCLRVSAVINGIILVMVTIDFKGFNELCDIIIFIVLLVVIVIVVDNIDFAINVNIFVEC